MAVSHRGKLQKGTQIYSLLCVQVLLPQGPECGERHAGPEADCCPPSDRSPAQGGARELAFLTCSQVMLILPTQEHTENHWVQPIPLTLSPWQRLVLRYGLYGLGGSKGVMDGEGSSSTIKESTGGETPIPVFECCCVKMCVAREAAAASA